MSLCPRADLLYFPQPYFLGHISDILTVILTSIPGIFVGVYHESIGIAGLHCIAFGIGLYGGAQIANAIQDNLYRRLSAHYGTDDCPEFRICKYPQLLHCRCSPAS